MWQDVTVYLIIVLATAQTVYQSIRIIAGNKTNECSGCPNCGIKNQLKHNR